MLPSCCSAWSLLSISPILARFLVLKWASFFPPVTQSYLFSVSCCISSDNSSLFSLLSITDFLSLGIRHTFLRAAWEGSQVLYLLLSPDLSSFSDLSRGFSHPLLWAEHFPHQVHCLSEDKEDFLLPRGVRASGPEAGYQHLPWFAWCSYSPLKAVLWWAIHRPPWHFETCLSSQLLSSS